jgi:hypothetical protein
MELREDVRFCGPVVIGFVDGEKMQKANASDIYDI